MQIINEIEICFVEIINEIQKSLARLNKEKTKLPMSVMKRDITKESID